MARVTIHYRVRSHQRKAVLVLLNLLYGHVPSLDRVALLAIGAQLATMNIRVAVGALAADVSKNRLGVALLACDAFVQSAQRKFSAIVIELGKRTNGSPAGNRGPYGDALFQALRAGGVVSRA